MKHLNVNDQNGFIALISTILISAVLIVLAVLTGRAAFWARFGLLAHENKKISAGLAEGCVQAALLKLARNENVDTAGQCEVIEISGSSTFEITARASWKDCYTNLKVTVKLENGEFKISDWKEF